jgi:hypothetical protein
MKPKNIRLALSKQYLVMQLEDLAKITRNLKYPTAKDIENLSIEKRSKQLTNVILSKSLLDTRQPIAK